jgi:hypothetical protein
VNVTETEIGRIFPLGWIRTAFALARSMFGMHVCLCYTSQIVKSVAPHSAASQHEDIQPGCILTHINGGDAFDFGYTMSTITTVGLPVRLTFFNPFAVGAAAIGTA